MNSHNFIVTCKRDGVRLLEKRYPSQAAAEEARKGYSENGANLILTDCREHVTFDSVELNVFETVYATPMQKGDVA